MADNFDYRLRPGKSIVRKLVFKWLDMYLSKDMEVHYLGFGSIFFADFLQAYKQLDLRNMTSLEMDYDKYQRAIFNKPYSCISIVNEDSTTLLTGLDFTQKRYIAWLDYTSRIDTTVLEDAEIFSAKALPGSVYIVTFNATNQYDKGVKEATEGSKQRPRFDNFKGILGAAVPASADHRMMVPAKFPALAVESLLNHIGSAVRTSSGNLREFVPILVLQHQDGATMVTIAGTIASVRGGDFSRRRVQAQGKLVRKQIQVEAPPRITVVTVPVLTPKEKHTLDALIPDSKFARKRKPSELTRDQVKKETKGVAITGKEWEAYLKYHLYYPVYTETSPWF